MDRLLERNQAVYAAALTARDAAQSLTDQAVVARDERDRLQQVAEQKMLESQQAADAAQAALDAQSLHLGELQAQLAALEDTAAKTIADYQAGVEAARIVEEQRRAAERAEAERLAAAAGTVVYAGYNGGYGNYIKIDHGGGIGTGYAHVRPGGFYVGYGQRVNAGDLMGSEGNTGNAFGCNLHFEAYVNGSPVNPIPFLADRGVSI